MAAFIRARCLRSGRAPKVRPVDRQELARVLGQLGKWGSNLNQLARAANMDEPVSRSEFEELASHVREATGAVLEALGVVIKGSARGGAGELTAHLLRVDTNETVNVMDMWGVSSLDLYGALAELDGMGAGSRSSRTLYHASINTPVVEQLTPKQQIRARERLAMELGLQAQPYVVVEHVKHGRQHTHVVWSRIDVETARAIPDSHNYRKHELVSRELEKEFGHQHVLGAHVRDKENEPRPQRGPSWGDLRQAERSGITPQEAKRIISECWKQTKTGRELRERLEAEGFILARGDRRDYVLIDEAGQVHGLARRIDGAKEKDVRDRMADIDHAALPTTQQVRDAQQADFTTTSERIRQDELKREARDRPAVRASLSAPHQEAADAIWQLNKTMRSQLEATLPRPIEKPQPAAKEDLYDRIMREKAARPDVEEAIEALKQQEERRRLEKLRNHGM